VEESKFLLLFFLMGSFFGVSLVMVVEYFYVLWRRQKKEKITKRIIAQALKLYKSHKEEIDTLRWSWGEFDIPDWSDDVQNEYAKLMKLCKEKEVECGVGE